MLDIIGCGRAPPLGPVASGATNAFANSVAPPGMAAPAPMPVPVGRPSIFLPSAAPGFTPMLGIAPAGTPGPTPGGTPPGAATGAP